jgi:hypothetical protein
MREIGLENYSAYRAHLEADPSEWLIFDECCHITISRFFRDRGIFDVVRRIVLPDIAARDSVCLPPVSRRTRPPIEYRLPASSENVYHPGQFKVRPGTPGLIDYVGGPS